MLFVTPVDDTFTDLRLLKNKTFIWRTYLLINSDDGRIDTRAAVVYQRPGPWLGKLVVVRLGK